MEKINQNNKYNTDEQDESLEVQRDHWLNLYNEAEEHVFELNRRIEQRDKAKDIIGAASVASADFAPLDLREDYR